MIRPMLALLVLCAFGAPLQAANVKVDGLSVHYTARGSGPAIIFVHGWTCDESSWRLQVPAFVSSHRVITIDLPGHGKSEVPALEKFSMNLFAAAVEAVREKEHVAKAVVVGHSMGAIVIRQYALNYPEHVAGLVAADGPLDVRTYAGRPGGQAPMTLAQRQGMIQGMFVAQTPEALRAEITKMMLATSETTATGAGAAMFDPANQSDKRIMAPALTIYAGTALFPQNQATREVLPNWESTQIAGTGHFVMMEKPQEFNRLLTAFLKDRAAY